MAQSADHYKKYQVYFFLYLAVICELLIIIVERDDAEADLLLKQRQLEEKNRRIILELLKNMPTVAAAGDNQLKVNESRYFTVRVKGLGDKDEVTTPPVVEVSKDGAIRQVLKYPEDIRDSSLESTTGERIYRFNWKADQGPGKFDFWVKAGTNRVELKPEIGREAIIKVGSLDFKREEIQKAIDFDPALKGTPLESFIQRSEQLDPARFTVDVISEAYDQLQIQADPIVTAVGFEAYNEIKVRGTTVDKVTTINVSGGGTSLNPRSAQNPWRSDDPLRGKWAWTGKFNEAGEKTITAEAGDTRGAGALSRSRPIQFNVIVKDPILARKRPTRAYSGESFEMNINVNGLEDVGSYQWKLLVDDKEAQSGTGSIVKYKLPDGAKNLSIKATYKDRGYFVYTDSSKKQLVPSDFQYPVVVPPYNITPQFSNSGEYPINTTFEFITDRCGRCISANIRNVPRNDIRVTVEDENGNDLLAGDPDIEELPATAPLQEGTRVRFYLKGKVKRDGTPATITIKAGTTTEKFNIILIPAEQ